MQEPVEVNTATGGGEGGAAEQAKQRQAAKEQPTAGAEEPQTREGEAEQPAQEQPAQEQPAEEQPAQEQPAQEQAAEDPTITAEVEQEIEEIKARSRVGLDEQLRRDRRAMTITDLDTGDEYVIGENDPDFEWDTFEIRAPSSSEKTTPQSPTPTPQQQQQQQQQQQTGNRAKKPSWWGNVWSLWGLLGPAGQGSPLALGNNNNNNNGYPSSSSSSSSPTYTASSARTPFTKLSAFKFRKELGRGAFGRVLLAEAKTDGSLYALKIISKKNMRSSDKRQAKAERDILHAMGQTAPHPFTTSLKFAFQSGACHCMSACSSACFSVCLSACL